MDNYGTHKTARIRNWFVKRPRFHVHFTPIYGSWLNLTILENIARFAQRTLDFQAAPLIVRTTRS